MKIAHFAILFSATLLSSVVMAESGSSHRHAPAPYGNLPLHVILQQGEVQAAPKKLTEQERFLQELEADKKLGKEASDYYDRMYRPSTDLAAAERVKRIGEELALIANSNPVAALWGEKKPTEFEYKFKLVQEKDVNAFSLPGGYIYVFQGLIDFCQSDDELAGVLAHEISHASQRHIAYLRREQSKIQALQIPLVLASILTGGAIEGLLLPTLAGTAVTNGWSQRAEESADYGAFQFMAMSKYNPTGLLTFMERLELQEQIMVGSEGLGIFRTHPPSRLRAEKIEGYMKKSKIAIKRSAVTTMFRASAKAEGERAAIFFGEKRLFLLDSPTNSDRTQLALKNLNAFFDSVPELFEVQTGEDGILYGRQKVLLRLTEGDAGANGKTLEVLQNDAVKAIRAALFRLAYHVWEKSY